MNRIRTSLVLTLAVLALVGATVHAAPDVSGTWTAAFETPIGEQKYAYELKVAADGKLTGTASGTMGKSDLTEGSVKADVVTFVEMLDGMIRVVYTGTIVSADEIKFSRVVGDFGTEEFVAKRYVPPAR